MKVIQAKPPESERKVALPLRLNPAAHEQLRALAYEARTSIHEQMIEALNSHFKANGKAPVA